ncbi:TonB-dependent receptor plug domain-containing protein [Rhizosaccharibacter radicis]|uniref:TonB-dependent receptor n=1 Tax=Rhizosaccharibacter radicis TaxID=2782605 RepID=A0ABT1VXH9_9PROT|nr:TonB-dependent receptor [Acetobacteraceae bacterium KSS12]
MAAPALASAAPNDAAVETEPPAADAPSPAPKAGTGAAAGRPRVSLSSAPAPRATPADEGSENVVVTGTLFRDPNVTSASPITRLSQKELQRRGVKSVADALQQLSSNGAGTQTNAWSAGGGFASGSSAPSLRGLSTDSTLTLFDGQRLSFYPLADDGQRNFADTTWIPMSIMQTVDVLEDGGSATYGADAVAGVINLIPRKEIKGWEANAEGGVAENGNSGHQRLYLTYGHGDLKRDGYNFYINGEYQQDDAYYYRQAGSPYNSGDLTGIGGTNGNYNVLRNGTITNFGATTVPLVRRSDGRTGGIGPYQLLNPAAGCGPGGSPVTGAATAGDGGLSQACGLNSEDYAQISPSLRRVNVNAHLTANVTDRSQFTAMFNYGQVQSVAGGRLPNAVRVQAQSRQVDTLSTPLPALLPNGELNPNNPFAAAGQAAQITYRFADLVPQTAELSQNYRGSARYSGWAPSNWGSDWNYDVNFVGMNTTLRQTITGVPTIRGIENAITNGTYNFVDPSQNSQAVLSAIAPKNVIHARTQLYSGEATLSKGLFNLPGGTAKLAVGGNIRYEALRDPSANPYDPDDPTAQYTGTINPVNAFGHRWVEAGFFEIDAPVIKMVDVDVSGRYDHYSEGFSRFSPKVGVILKPVEKLWLRGTFSKGFRVPSFAETGGSNVGYTSYTPTNANFISQHLGPNGQPNAYAQTYNIGSNTSGNPNLKPEVSTNFSGGPVFRPTRWLTLTADYYYIRKDNFIAPNPIGTATVANNWLANPNAYSNGGPISVTPDIPDQQNLSGQLRPALINLGYVNTNKLVTDGFDLAFQAHTQLPGIFHDVSWISQGRATFVHRFNLTTPDGQVQRYAGTLGPVNQVSGAGTPHWRANWSNTLVYKKLAVTPTVYYTGGYKTTAEDAAGAGTRNDCSTAQQTNSFVPVQCGVDSFWDVDLTVSYQITPKLTTYVNIYNLLGFRAPYDFGTYGGYLYNPAWAQKGIVQRNFQFGLTATF